MRRVYLFVYAGNVGKRDQVEEWVDSMPEVLTWRYDMPNSFYLVSNKSADELCDAFREKSGTDGRFLISEITSNKQGLLPSDTWYFINNKKVKPKDG